MCKFRTRISQGKRPQFLGIWRLYLDASICFLVTASIKWGVEANSIMLLSNISSKKHKPQFLISPLKWWSNTAQKYEWLFCQHHTQKWLPSVCVKDLTWEQKRGLFYYEAREMGLFSFQPSPAFLWGFQVNAISRTVLAFFKNKLHTVRARVNNGKQAVCSYNSTFTVETN